METEEVHIVQGIRAGEEASYRRLYDLFYTGLVAFAMRYTEDMESARDIVQEIFVRMYETRESIGIHTSLRSFLYTLVRNACLNRIKHEQVKERHRGTVRQEADQADIEERIDAAELESRIHSVISGLPDQCRRIFMMSRTDNKSNSEIAEELKLSVRTVETQISKALKVLREALLNE